VCVCVCVCVLVRVRICGVLFLPCSYLEQGIDICGTLSHALVGLFTKQKTDAPVALAPVSLSAVWLVYLLY
jgi:hypothetical protein